MFKRLSFAVAVFVWAAGIAPMAEAAARIQPGEEMPDFTLKDYAGKEHRLSDYRGKIVVIEFCSQGCPWSRGVEPDMAALAKEYGGEEVVFLGIDADRDNSVESIAKHAEESGIPFPILKDVDNAYADAVMATRTPELYIVDAAGVLAYHGAFDNRVAPTEAGDEAYGENALKELVAGKKVSTPKVSAWGCSIKRVAKRAL